MSQLLVEKYRPKTIEEMVGFVPTFSIDDTLPHLLLYGSPGTGKTTLAKIIILMLGCDSITLNASSERGIETVRQKVSEFASTQSVNSGIKIVFLDESDHLTPDAQTALRNIMETYATNTRFILTANYINRIIDPIKSRCVQVKFDKLPKDKIVERIKFICENEKIPYELPAISKIVEQAGSDIRSAINAVERMKSGVLLSKLQEENSTTNDIFEKVVALDFEGARNIILTNNVDYDVFLRELTTLVWSSKLSQSFKEYAIGQIAETCRWLSQVAWKEIQIENLLLNLVKALRKC